MAGAVVAAVLDIVSFGEWWNQGSASADLADAVQDDFGAAIVELDQSVNFNGAAGQAAHVADILQIVGEDHDGEGACHLIFAEIEEVNAGRVDFDAQDFAGHALGFAHVLASFADGDAVGSEDQRCRQKKGCKQASCCLIASHVSILEIQALAVCDGTKKMCRTLPEWNGQSTAWASLTPSQVTARTARLACKRLSSLLKPQSWPSRSSERSDPEVQKRQPG